MILAEVFKPFIEARPIAVMARGALERLLNAKRVDKLFERTAKRQYTRELLFSTLVKMMSEVVLGVQPSVHASYQTRIDEMKVSTTALYNKLDRVETDVAAELVRDSFSQVAPVIAELDTGHEPWLAGYPVKVIDGNHLSGTEHRIKELRNTWAAALPGKALVVLDERRGLMRDVFLTEDGHAQERSLITAVLETVEAGDLWIADRNLCTLGMLFGIARREAYFLVRQHGQLKGRLVGPMEHKGETETGTVYEQAIVLTDPASGEEMTARRITVRLKQPTREGDTVIHLLSNVPHADASAVVLSQLYRRRWTIENAFFQITTTLTCEINTLGYPKAALFAFCLALLAYNAVAVIQAALAQVHGQQKIHQEVSSYYLSLEVQQTYDGMMVAIPSEHWTVFQEMTVPEFTATLCQIARHANLAKYKKHPRGPKKKPPPKAAYQNGAHVSTARILAQRRSC